MRTMKRYIPVFLLCMIIFLVVDNYEEVIKFFDTAEVHLTKQLNEITSNGYLVNENELAGLEDSGITGSEYSFDTKYYPYYNLLTVEGQLLYKQIYANMEHLAPTFVPIINVPVDDVQLVMEAIYNDHPELFWINTSYSYKYIENNVVVQITLSYNETASNIDSAKKKFSDITDRIIKEANTYSTNYEKEKYVHDEILKLVSYDTNAPMNQSAYSALVNGKTVCAGYARAFQYIMIELGIPTYYISGYSNQDHAWNIINLDGEYYNVDLTWDDSSNNSYQFFNLTDTEFKKTHTRKSLSIKMPSCQGTKHRYYEPEIPIDDSENNSTNVTPITPSMDSSNIDNPDYYEPQVDYHYSDYNYNNQHHPDYDFNSSYQNTNLHHQNNNHHTEYDH